MHNVNIFPKKWSEKNFPGIFYTFIQYNLVLTIVQERRNNMVMQNKPETGVASTLDNGLVVPEHIVAGQSYCACRNGFKESKTIPRGFAKKHQEPDAVLPHNNLQDITNLQDIITEYLGHNNKARPITGSPDDHLITELIARFQHGSVLQDVRRGSWTALPWKQVDRRTEQSLEAPKK